LTVDLNTGQLSVVGDLDYEKLQSISFFVTAEDSGNPKLRESKEVVLNILDQNDNSPVFPVTSYTLEVFEKANVGTIILQVKAEDADSSAPFGTIGSYFISGGDGGNAFTLDNNGVLRLNQPLNFDIRQTYRLEIKARDNAPQGQQRDSETPVIVIINVRDQVEQGPQFLLDTYIVAVKENIALNTEVLRVNATSTEPGALTYNIVDQANPSTDGNSFRIQPTNGQIFRRLGFDYESKKFYSFNVIVTNTANQKTDRARVVVRILDINDNQPIFSNLQRNSFDVSEKTIVGSTVADLNATDADGTRPNNLVRYRVIGGDGQGVFTVQETGHVLLSANLDHAAKQTYSLVVQAFDLGVDPGPLNSLASLTFNIKQTYINIPNRLVTIPENTAVSSVIVTVSAVDPNNLNQNGFKYYLIGNVSNQYFTINSDNGEIRLRQALDYELYKRHTIIYQARGPTANGAGQVIVDVTDINDNSPVFTQDTYNVNAPETHTIDQYLARVHATDADASSPNNQIRYSLKNNPENKFQVDPVSGFVTLRSSFDYEGPKTYFITVAATDLGSPSRTTDPQGNARIIVTVRDNNDNFPIMQPLYRANVSEAAAPGLSILTIAAQDNDDSNENNRFTFSISQPLASQYFQINANTGVITLRAPVDYEDREEFHFPVIATDSGEVPYTRTTNVEIMVLNVPDTRPRFSPLEYNITIPESTNVDTSLLQLHVVDQTLNLRFSIRPGGNDDGKFQLIESSGELFLRQPVDREVKDFYTMKATVADSVNSALTDATINVRITDVNDNAPRFSQSTCFSVNINEAQSTFTINNVIAVDVDAGSNAQVTYSFVNTCPILQINSNTGLLTLNGNLNYETQTKHTCVVKATDAGNPTLSGYACVDINVLDSNDERPTFRQLTYNVTVQESALRGTLVAHVYTTDRDSAVNSGVTYSIAGGNQENMFSIDSIGKITLVGSLDYERTKLYELEIQARDSLLTSAPNAKVFVTIAEVNDNRPRFTNPLNFYKFSVPESATEGTEVGTLSATDADDGAATGSFTFTALDNTTAFFIESNGIIRVRGPLDYETKKMYSLVAQVSDNGVPSLSSRALVDIEIQDVNDNRPIFNPTVYDVLVSEKAPVTTSLTRVFAEDVDSVENAQIVYTSTNMPSKFRLDQTTGVVTLAETLDLEPLQSNQAPFQYQFVVTASAPSNTGVNTAIVRVQVRDVDDNEPVFATNVYTFTVLENQPANTIIGSTVAATDRDRTQNAVTYSIVSSTDSVHFSINNQGQLSSTRPFDYEEQTYYQFEVEATDSAAQADQLHGRALVKVYIQDLNDNSPQPQPQSIEVTITEDTRIASLILVVNATDKDSGSNGELRFSLSGPGASTFTIDDFGYMRLASRLDRLTTPQYRLTANINDRGTPVRSNTASIVVNVVGVNFTLLAFQPVCPILFKITENSNAGTFATLRAVDTGEYNSRQITYSIRSNNTDSNTK
jgi:hypothetical protein